MEFLNRPMHELTDLNGTLDVAVAVNSVVMPDVRLIDRTLSAVRSALKPEGAFLGVVPSMDAIHYHTMLLMDQSLDRGAAPEEAERYAAFHGEHGYYDFAFGRFAFQGLKQKFWHPFELRHRLNKAGFRSVTLDPALPGARLTPNPGPNAAGALDREERPSQTVAKTLKCGECGSLNRPTEWYCERCGAELAAL